MNVIITGATGMIGGLVLKECLSNPEISNITCLVRKPTGISNEKLIEVIVEDFMDYSSIENHFQNQQIAYFCIGVYTGSVPRDAFRRITIDYTTVFADTLKKQSPDATFCFLSGQGADSKEKSKVIFALDKGKAENYLIKSEFSKSSLELPSPDIPFKFNLSLPFVIPYKESILALGSLEPACFGYLKSISYGFLEY
mgnify:CR=1 FL=1